MKTVNPGQLVLQLPEAAVVYTLPRATWGDIAAAGVLLVQSVRPGGLQGDVLPVAVLTPGATHATVTVSGGLPGARYVISLGDRGFEVRVTHYAKAKARN